MSIQTNAENTIRAVDSAMAEVQRLRTELIEAQSWKDSADVYRQQFNRAQMKVADLQAKAGKSFTSGRIAGLREAAILAVHIDTYDSRKACDTMKRLANRLERELEVK